MYDQKVLCRTNLGRTHHRDMHSSNHDGILNPRLVVLTLALILAGCGGSGGSASPDLSSSGSSTGSGSGTGSGAANPGAPTILFEQPQDNGIGGHFFVPLAAQGSRPKGEFALVLWQVDPFTPNGELVPTSWDAGSKTGFTPSTTLNVQLGFRDMPGTTTAQMDGDVVGAYLNSEDLPSAPVGQKMMITPEYVFLSGTEPMPFASSNAVLILRWMYRSRWPSEKIPMSTRISCSSTRTA